MNSLDLIKATTGTNEKIFLAVNNFTEKEHEFMTECFNKIIYGISETNLSKALDYDSFIHGRFEDLGDYLYKYPISQVNQSSISIREFIKEIILCSGNKQIDLIRSLFVFNISKDDAPWYLRVLLKNPRIGISEITYDKIREKCNLPPLPKRFVKLAKLLEPEEFGTLKYPVGAEIKYDGERAEITYNNEYVLITSRNGNDITFQFPEIVNEIRNYFKDTDVDIITLDGEIISKSFNSLQKRMGRLEKNIELDYDITFICFDILNNKGTSLKNVSQIDRRLLLEFYKNKVNLTLSESVICKDRNEVLEFYNKAVDNKEEGIILKEMDAILAIKKDDREKWYKVKPVYTSDLEIYDAAYGNGKNKDYINILAVRDKSGIIKSNVSAGMTDEMRKLCTNLFHKTELIGTIVEIKYNLITETNSLRHPRIIKLRFDKDTCDTLKY